MKRFLFFALVICACVTNSSAQVIKRYHQNFSVDSLSSLRLEVEGDVAVNTWAGNTLLVEISVNSANGSNSVLNFLQKEGRYDLELQTTVVDGVLRQKAGQRQGFKIKGVDLEEIIKYTISVPDSFIAEDLQTFRKVQ
jgi:hypothetical protein